MVKYLVITILCFTTFLKTAYSQSDSLLGHVFINELMSSNSILLDEQGEADDWIEIYNAGGQPLFIGGLYFTDDLEDLKKWRILHSTLIPPNGFKLLWADGQPEQGGHHLPFKLKREGEAFAIVQELEGALHILDSITFPTLLPNTSFGRTKDGGETWAVLSEPSPNASNNQVTQQFFETVTFSQPEGIYEESVVVAMSSTAADVEIRYTLDGSIPDTASPLYQAPITITQTSQVQARAFKTGFSGAEITSAFFVINEPSNIPILNIQTDPDNLWDEQIGIYVKGENGAIDYCDPIANNWNQDWERPCQLTFFEPDGTDGFTVNAGMKIGGACSRNLKMKSFNFFMRNNDYGDELIDYPIFPNQDITEYRRIKIRNGGTDWREMLFRDGMNHHLLANTVDIDLVAYRPVRVYLNGQYWGVYGIREMLNKHYIASHHGVNPDSVDILGDPYGPRSIVREGDDIAWNNFYDYLTNNDVNQENHYNEIRERIDLQQFINYYITQIYLANFDWPGNNVRVWRDRNNGKFRWMLFDTDTSAGWDSWGAAVAKATHNSLAHSLNTGEVNRFVPGFTEWPNGRESTYIFRKLMESETFKSEFLQRTCTFRELIFAPERVSPMVDSMQQLLLPEMERHIQKWNGNNHFGKGTPSGGSVANWMNIIAAYKNFFISRAFRILSIFEKELDLEGTYELTITTEDSSKGKVVLHDNEMQIPDQYNGEYFQNIPVTIKAIPMEGYVFSHWQETGNTNSEFQFIGTTDATLTPVFISETVPTKEQGLAKSIALFPNPATDFLSIQFEGLKKEMLHLQIFNSLGHAAFSQTSSSIDNIRLPVTQLPKGIYWLSVSDVEGRKYSLLSRRFVVH